MGDGVAVRREDGRSISVLTIEYEHRRRHSVTPLSGE
jgi:hypothetical protein